MTLPDPPTTPDQSPYPPSPTSNIVQNPPRIPKSTATPKSKPLLPSKTLSEPKTPTMGTAAAVALHILLASVTVPSVYFIITQNLNTLFDLVNHPAQTLRVLTILHAPVVIGSYSSLRRDPQHCTFWKAAARGLMGLPIGALLNAFGAIVLGAPVGFKYLMQTVYWSLLMSLFTFVPPSCAFGLSRMDWQHLLAHSKPTEMTEYLISLPAHGAIVGAWLGAWPMPLDWDMPWQEWPICVTFGAIGGYFVGLLASLVCILLQKPIRAKAD